MNTKNRIVGNFCRQVFNLFAIASLFPAFAAGAAGPETTHIALIPFSAPAGNPKLKSAASVLPDLLSATLTQDGHFELVERTKINNVCNELHLTEAGLVSPDTVAKLGQMLSCDWLIGGSLLQSGTNTLLWIKVVNTQNSVLLDLKPLPYNPANFPALAADVARFLAQIKARGQPREFVALGKFEDRSVGTKQADWTPRLTTLVEKTLLGAQVTAWWKEKQWVPFSMSINCNPPASSSDGSRLKLTPAFWVISGNWDWSPAGDEKLDVTIEIQRMGGKKQLLSFAKPAGDEVDKAVVETLLTALKATGSLTAEQALAAEHTMHGNHVEELSKGRGETFTPSRFGPGDAAALHHRYRRLWRKTDGHHGHKFCGTKTRPRARDDEVVAAMVSDQARRHQSAVHERHGAVWRSRCRPEPAG